MAHELKAEEVFGALLPVPADMAAEAEAKVRVRCEHAEHDDHGV